MSTSYDLPKYVIQRAEKSRCPDCNERPDLLAPDTEDGAMFYICWKCRKVFQAGVGEVPREGVV